MKLTYYNKTGEKIHIYTYWNKIDNASNKILNYIYYKLKFCTNKIN